MTFDIEIKLIKKTTSENSMGDPIETSEKRAVLASELGYRNKEFDQAMASGLKPSKTFAINKYDYDDEKELEHEGRIYRIIDVYPVKQPMYREILSEFESIALICEGLVNS